MTQPQANVTSAERIAELEAKFGHLGYVITKEQFKAGSELVAYLKADLATCTAERDEALKALEPFGRTGDMPLSNASGFALLKNDASNPIGSSYRWHRCDVEAELAKRAARILAKHQSG